MVSVEGDVTVQRGDSPEWQEASLGGALCERDSVRVGARSRGTIALINDAILRLDQNTTIHLLDITQEPEERSLLDLITGAFQSFSRSPRSMAVNTPYLNATIEGTELALRVDGTRSQLTVLEGTVAAENPQGRIQVSSGQSVTAEAGQAPAYVILVQPRDTVQWALYYPPILAALGGQPEQIPSDLPPALARALELAGKNNATDALAVLDQMPAGEQDSQYSLYRAALLLNVGRDDEARIEIDRSLSSDPNAGLAYALRSIINLVQNRKADALADAERAVNLSPKDSASRIALSYAEQAHFNLEAARDTLLHATAENPRDALAWARLAELWLMLGYRDRSEDAAERALSLAPNLERVQIVRGFSALAAMQMTEAKAAFARSISLDSADPMARLGLGLTLIRQGHLEQGRRQLEMAVGLDGSNALLRAYLGKAYFEEKRDPLDADQFIIAKELDPLDPTAYFYDALRKQSENMPVAALRDLQDAIERNDNRAIYRSRQLLDQDRAARGASLARIYEDLGFYQLGVNEASKSLTVDPGSAAAHRFLSDSYQGVRRREISRVSELLQAQMLQDININPVQPSISETNLNIVTRGGPTETGFNEFTPLFERNEIQFNSAGLAGDDDTFGGEGVASAIYDRLSISAGGFHHETDGWRDNNDINHDIYNAYAQYALTPDLNLQLEYRHRNTDFGDLEFRFDPDDFSESLDNEFNQDIARVGLRYSPAPHSDVLLSYIFSDRKGSSSESFTDGPFVFGFDNPIDQHAHQIEGQYIFHHDWLNVVAGAAYNNIDTDEGVTLTMDGITLIDDQQDFSTDDYRGYLYANINFPESVIWTVGFNYTDFDEGGDPGNEVSRVNPKVGVQWDIIPDLRFRAAYFETVKPTLAANRTLEPTQVAGFNQFFDEANGTKSSRYGFGLDWQVLPDLAIGGEMTWRDIEEPFTDASVTPARLVEDDANEELFQAYIYWTPWDEIAVRTGFTYDKYEKESDDFSLSVDNQNPLEVETMTVPLAVTYFHSSGFFAGASVSLVDQEVERLPDFSNQGEDTFAVVDMGLGYRFPNRHGILSLQVQNLFDEGFQYQDDSYREVQDQPSVGPYFPDRTIVGRLILNF